ncbi:hypothetical protein GA0061098_1007158 [Bradyrhizobium shewense]|uniref:Uncharacterized protein n=1 Tax=Bradyrhizobium shewense TaxID=1761772 RepID=A0A1C3WD99_9BRAD|nr:hypothetical protein [Bradyrhizobium shewense]SCB37664.1 hypothetical protein GA0061098_1007158 [Bradyrhizobium shewense]
MNEQSERGEPDRYVDQPEAVRRLIHSAIRMFAIGEDPFAIHLLIQSADKLILDIARKRNVSLAFDWEHVIKKEHQREFFQLYRETYNFFKHADKGSERLPVHNIAEGNAAQLSIVIENYLTLFGSATAHMTAFRWFARLWKPSWFFQSIEDLLPQDRAQELLKAWTVMRNGRPQEFFAAAFAKGVWNTAALEEERNLDFADNIEFYSTRFVDMD